MINSPELQALIEEYRQEQTKHSRLIHRMLMHIARLCDESDTPDEQILAIALAEAFARFIKHLKKPTLNIYGDEFIYIFQIIKQFDLIAEVVKEESKKGAEALVQGLSADYDDEIDLGGTAAGDIYRYIPRTSNGDRFIDGDDMLNQFKGFLSQTVNSKGENPSYLTITDYASRIKTFAKNDAGNAIYSDDKYLRKIVRSGALGQIDYDRIEDKVLFTYNNIEIILAHFDTRKSEEELREAGASKYDKQKNNIRSALRKLNEFKREYKR